MTATCVKVAYVNNIEYVGVEAGKTKEAEKPAAADEGKKVVEPAIGEAEPVTETE